MQVHTNTNGVELNLEELILSCQPWVERMARRYAREWFKVDFDDFVSIGMLAICKEASNASTVATNPMAYLVKTAQNAMIDELRRMRKQDTASLDAPLSPDGSFSLADLLVDCPSDAPVNTSVEQAVNDALGRLPVHLRAALCRRSGLLGHGVSSREDTAQSLKLAKSSVSRYSLWARQALRSDALLCEFVGVQDGKN
jgi:RNA polymerase sigma factor (sigma-70 family)